MTKDEALKMAIEAIDYKGVRDSEPYWEMMNKAIQACKEALEQPSVAELNNEYLRDTYVQGLSQPAQEPIVIGIDFAKNQWKESMIKFLKEKQICAFDNNKIIMQSWIDELENK